MKNPNIKTAVRLYYEKPELETADIMKLFSVSTTKANNMKKDVRKRMAELGVKVWLPYSINTNVAYEVWGIDINDMEKRLKKLQSLGMEDTA